MSLFRTERGLDRLVNFSDAAVAIAITLLVLPLVDFAPEITHTTLGHLLGEHWETLLAFVISFAVIGNFWIVHHQLFELVVDYTYTLAWLDLLWLFSIIVVPFSTAVLANAPSGIPEIYLLYIGTMILSSGSMLLMRVVLQQRPELIREEVRGQLKIAEASVPTAILVLALILALIFPGVGIYWLFLLFLSAPGTALVRRLTGQPRSDSSPRA
jgi:uncharacterized membrane protein